MAEDRFFKAKKCVKCKYQDCKNIVYLNKNFEKTHKFSDVMCPKYTIKK